MSLFDKLTPQGFGNRTATDAEGQGDVLQMVMALVIQSGGIEGIVRKFAQHGMGELATQWVGTGSNPPITGEQFTQVFGAPQVNQLAQRMGLSAPQAAAGLAALLPTVIDKLTPGGKALERGDLESGVFRLMSGGTQGLGLGDVADLFRP